MKTLGIDLGSRAVKIAMFNDNKLLKTKIIDTMKFYREYSLMKDGKIYLNLDLLEIDDDYTFVSTGYGRNNINVSDSVIINEIKAHAYGIIYQTQLKDFTALDIGGQDFKIIKVEKGIIVDMLLNDKCAASSGRYLENMSNIIDMPLEELKKHYKNPIELNTTCAVFGESELIGKIAEGYSVEELAAGINFSLYKRVLPLLKRLASDTTVLSGGVALNDAIVNYFKNDFKNIRTLDYPQLNGAIGCGYYRNLRRKYDKKRY